MHLPSPGSNGKSLSCQVLIAETGLHTEILEVNGYPGYTIIGLASPSLCPHELLASEVNVKFSPLHHIPMITCID